LRLRLRQGPCPRRAHGARSNGDNTSVIAQEEIFGPVLSVIPADDEADAVRIANETIYGLHGAVFTNDNDRAREVAGQMRTGNIGHNGFKTDFQLGFGPPAH
jgi:aldehyde dehydrogenase (NAD+)